MNAKHACAYASFLQRCKDWSHSLYELKSEEPKVTDWKKYDISKALIPELGIVGNEGSNPQPERHHGWTKQPCVPLKPLITRNSVVSNSDRWRRKELVNILLYGLAFSCGKRKLVPGGKRIKVNVGLSLECMIWFAHSSCNWSSRSPSRHPPKQFTPSYLRMTSTTDVACPLIFQQ